MRLIDIKRDPSRWEVVLLAIAITAVGLLLAALVLWSPATLRLIIGVMTAAWLISTIGNREESRRGQLLGLVLPLLLVTVLTALQTGIAPIVLAAGLATSGLALAAVAIGNRGFGNRLYVTWAQIFLPVGWTVSYLLLAVVYYLVVTPIGCLRRLLGGDPMRRKFDSTAKSYWVERENSGDAERYFQQF